MDLAQCPTSLEGVAPCTLRRVPSSTVPRTPFARPMPMERRAPHGQVRPLIDAVKQVRRRLNVIEKRLAFIEHRVRVRSHQVDLEIWAACPTPDCNCASANGRPDSPCIPECKPGSPCPSAIHSYAYQLERYECNGGRKGPVSP